MEGSDQGALGTEQAPAEAEVQEQAVQQPAATEQVQPEAEPKQAVDWATQALPTGHPAGTKYKTIGDLTRAYEASGNEGRRLYRENQEMRRQLQALSKPAQPAQQDASKSSYFGFGSREQYLASLNQDLEGTMKKVVETFAKGLVAQETEGLKTQLGEFKARAAAEQRDAQYAKLASRYPELNDTNSPGNQAAVRFLDQNPWVADLTANPEVNAFEVTYKLATYDLLAAKLADAENKLKAHGARAQAARPGSGAPKQVKQDNSSSSAVDAAAEDVRARGEEVDQKWIDLAKKASKRVLGW